MQMTLQNDKILVFVGCSLLDAYELLHPNTALPSHRRGSEMIDIIYVSPRDLPCISRAGICL